MSTAYTDSGPIVKVRQVDCTDLHLLEKRTHQVFLEQLAEILDCPAQASSVIEAVIQLREEHKNCTRRTKGD